MAVRLVISAFIWLGLTSQATATLVEWGNTGTTFSTAGNWVGGTAPANNLTSDIGVFRTGTVTNNPNLTASRSINGLQFDSGTGAWTFSGSGGTRILTLGSSGIVSNDDSTQTFNNASLGIALGANAAFTSNSTGALSFGSTLASFALSTFTLTLNGTSTNTANAIAEPISGTGGITKDGAGTWLLSGANTYTGKTIINNGVLAITAETGLGANPGASVADQLTLNGGTLRTQTANVTINDANREIFIGASGGTFDTVTNLTIASTNIISGSGALNKTGAGNLTLQSVSTYSGNLTVSAGTVTYGVSNALSTGGVTVSGGTLAMGTFSDTVGAVSLTSGSITGSSGVLTGSSYDMQSGSVTAILGGSGVALNKTTAGTVTLSGANTYTGLTTVSAGTLAYGASNVLSTGAVTVDGGTAVLALGANQSDSVGTVTLANGGSITGSGTSTLTSTGSFDMQSGSVTAILGGGVALNKTTSGTVTLSGANTYTGTTNIGAAGGANAGTLTLGANNVLPGSTLNIFGGTLDLNSRTDTVGAINLGGGASGSTAGITGTTGTLTLGGNITYSATNNPNGADISANFNLGGADRTITVGNSSGAATDLTLGAGDFTDTITLGSNTLIIDGAGNTLINSFVGASGDTGGFTKNGTGTVTFFGDKNNYTGTTTVNDGTLILDTLNTTVDETIRGNLVIGDSTGAADSATVIYQAGVNHNKIANTSAVTINSDGVLNLNSNDDTIGSFTLSGGHITTGTGVLTLAGNITTTANAAAQTAVIDGVLDLGSSTRTFTIANDTPTSDLTINAVINQGSFVKEGAGTMTITSNNTIGYGGTTTVNAGVLNIQHANALGQTGASDVLKGTTVATAAALQLQGGIAVGTEALSLSGTGVSSDGALRNISGDNSWAGAITLAAASRINSDSGTLTLGGSVVATNQNLTVGGTGNTTINGAVGTGTGTLTKDGTGILTLTGDNTYSGTTTISVGVVNIRHDSALGSTGAGTTVSSGATLQLQNNITVGSEALALTGAGVGSAGALQNVSGTNTYGGAITVGAGGARINSDAGTLALTGNITLGANTLTVGGAGDTTQSAVIAGTGGLTKDGAGTLTLAGANTYTGATTISAGTLRLGAGERIDNLSAVSVAGGATFDGNGYTETIGSLAGAGSVTLGSGNLTTGGNDANTTFSGTLTGTGASSLTKAGIGTMTIDSNLGFGGDLNLTAGTLQFDVSNAFTGITTISAGTLRLSSSTLTLGTLNITGNTTIDFAGTASILSVTTLNISNGVVVTIQNWQNAVDFFYAQDWTGAVVDTTGSAPMNQVVFNGFVGNNTKWQSYDDQVTPVPEPSAYGALLMGAGVTLFGLRRWGRKCAARLGSG